MNICSDEHVGKRFELAIAGFWISCHEPKINFCRPRSSYTISRSWHRGCQCLTHSRHLTGCRFLTSLWFSNFIECSRIFDFSQYFNWFKVVDCSVVVDFFNRLSVCSQVVYSLQDFDCHKFFLAHRLSFSHRLPIAQKLSVSLKSLVVTCPWLLTGCRLLIPLFDYILTSQLKTT